jgi:hypothetical protein
MPSGVCANTKTVGIGLPAPSSAPVSRAKDGSASAKIRSRCHVRSAFQACTLSTGASVAATTLASWETWWATPSQPSTHIEHIGQNSSSSCQYMKWYMIRYGLPGAKSCESFTRSAPSKNS